MTGSSRINSHTDLKMIDETGGNIIIERDDLLVNERNIDRQTHTHQSLNSLKIQPSEFLQFKQKIQENRA